MFYWVCKYILIGPFLRVFFRPVLEGVENIPATGPVILASNHLSFSDSFFFPLMVPRRIIFLAKAEYFTGKGLKGLFSRLFFSAAGCVPIDRASGSAAEAALLTGARVLGEGHPLGIYPEGTRSPDGKLYRGKTGVARLALETGVPVVPVAMINTDQVQPIGRLIPRIMRVRMRVGKPLDFSRYAGMAGNRFVERSVTDQIMYDLMQLSGQRYADVYAASVKNNSTPVDADQRAAESVAA
ncbi:lysophospholipid acyltransferase family protein [Cryptosporangium sp. NPDC051539]|uniref:lysophospholipid acyltransferase family protein n=1 Tax=Cryptosporangium sp. NPDC051539 TaxID=3363962 RepID=UPI00378974C9